ncbi:ABC transporter ATP-binding protein [Isoptericola halotolerans]|uniref:ABC-2 type transport system ATP-binding protein n=1 Tax=Isoptericola halotolerans TaxID=300560 RepID=A0ABX2A3C4_9MICO|nr:ABC transporter ATP-binding protein [Isoptericola halotolerans]NOV97245.1 ABC-2 type transport system ATP-binding protein [Isoptericola halotolerans]
MATTPLPMAPEEATMTSEHALVSVRGLTVRYGTRTALDDLDLELPAGRIIGLLGENGCGKSTLLKTLAGLYADYTGEVRVGGHAPGPRSKALVSYLPDRSSLPDHVRVRYCLDLFSDMFADFDTAKAREMIAGFGLDESMRLKEMSKGMREKVQVSLAMARRARVFLLDEPISGVDPAARDGILDRILGNLEPGSSLLVATHLVHDLETTLDSVVIMRHGKVLLEGEVDDLRAEHGSSLDQIFRKVYRS